MSDLTKIAVDAMGGDGSPKKIIDGILLHQKIINKICLLKNQEWNYGFNSNLKWFWKNYMRERAKWLVVVLLLT